MPCNNGELTWGLLHFQTLWGQIWTHNCCLLWWVIIPFSLAVSVCKDHVAVTGKENPFAVLFEVFEITESISALSVWSHIRLWYRHWALPASILPHAAFLLTFLFLQHSGSLCRLPRALLCPCFCYPTCFSRAQGTIRLATWKTQVERKSWSISLLLLNFHLLYSVLSYCKNSLCCFDVVGIVVQKTGESQGNSTYFSFNLQSKFLKDLQRPVSDFNSEIHTREWESRGQNTEIWIQALKCKETHLSCSVSVLPLVINFTLDLDLVLQGRLLLNKQLEKVDWTITLPYPS